MAFKRPNPDLPLDPQEMAVRIISNVDSTGYQFQRSDDWKTLEWKDPRRELIIRVSWISSGIWILTIQKSDVLIKEKPVRVTRPIWDVQEPLDYYRFVE
jgi:hypothetical protein